MKKIIATGKGGVGKTTIIATLSRLLAKDGYRVLVIDTDPSMNLAMSLGVRFSDVTTLADHKLDLRREIGADGHEDEPGHGHSHGETDIDAILMQYTILVRDKVRLLVMGTIPFGGAGCICSSVSLVKLIVERLAKDSTQYDFILVDSQAGSEILGRGFATDYDCNLLVTEATPKALDVARHMLRLAKDLHIRDELIVVNKVESDADIATVARYLAVSADRVCGVKYDRQVAEADRAAKELLEYAPASPVIGDIRRIEKAIE